MAHGHHYHAVSIPGKESIVSHEGEEVEEEVEEVVVELEMCADSTHPRHLLQ